VAGGHLSHEGAWPSQAHWCNQQLPMSSPRDYYYFFQHFFIYTKLNYNPLSFLNLSSVYFYISDLTLICSKLLYSHFCVLDGLLREDVKESKKVTKKKNISVKKINSFK